MPRNRDLPSSQPSRHERASSVKNRANYPGQHLLRSRRIIRRMIELARICPQPLVLDIGAGLGALTVPLADEGWRVLAVENDSRLAGRLRGRMAAKENVRVVEQDVLRTPLPHSPFSVVANIPFAITTGILGRLMDCPASAFQRGVLLIQHEAARRFMRSPITDIRLLVWRMWFRWELVEVVPPRHFAPPPNVNAALLTVSRRREALLPAQEYWRFLGLAQSALSAPEMPLGQALRDVFTPTQLRLVFRTTDLQRETPVCRMTEQQWAIVYHTMHRHVPPARWPRASRPRWFR